MNAVKSYYYIIISQLLVHRFFCLLWLFGLSFSVHYPDVPLLPIPPLCPVHLDLTCLSTLFSLSLISPFETVWFSQLSTVLPQTLSHMCFPICLFLTCLCTGILDYLLACSLLSASWHCCKVWISWASCCAWTLFSCCFEDSLKRYIMRQDVALRIEWLVLMILASMRICISVFECKSAQIDIDDLL